MIDLDQLGRDRDFIRSLDIDFEGLEDDRVLRILEALQISNRSVARWQAVARDLHQDVTRLLEAQKSVTITLPDGVTITCDASAVGTVMAQVSPTRSRRPDTPA